MRPATGLFEIISKRAASARICLFSVLSVSLWFVWTLSYRDMNTGQVELRSTYSVVDPSTISMIRLCP
jgi:hypothetical protein